MWNLNNIIMSERKQMSDGGIWFRKSESSGAEYLFLKVEIPIFGKIKTFKFKAFPNNKKQEGESTPDFRVYSDEKFEAKRTAEPAKEDVQLNSPPPSLKTVLDGVPKPE